MRHRKTITLDATMPTIVIPVSTKLIENSIKADSHHCMIADAVKARIPNAQFISVDLQSVRFTDAKTKIRYKYFTPLYGQQALVKFDRGDKIKPFAITLKDGTKENVAVSTAKRKKRADSRKGNHGQVKRSFKSRAKKERKFGLRNLEA